MTPEQREIVQCIHDFGVTMWWVAGVSAVVLVILIFLFMRQSKKIGDGK